MTLGVADLPSGLAGEEPPRTATSPKLGEESPPEGEAGFIKQMEQPDWGMKNDWS
ncbi:MAG: hypothetical protein WKF75_07155 [Singulisphaera sp.]